MLRAADLPLAGVRNAGLLVVWGALVEETTEMGDVVLGMLVVGGIAAVFVWLRWLDSPADLGGPLGPHAERSAPPQAKSAKPSLEELKQEGQAALEDLNHAVGTHMDVRSCPQCAELDLVLDDVSPNGRSITVRCKYCGHCYRMKCATDDTAAVRENFDRFKGIEGQVRRLLDARGQDLVSEISLNLHTLPSCKTGREPVPKPVRRAVWQREGGRCTECGADQDLQFDHIIPVSKGGATTVENLQILCGDCSRRKGATI
jgi:hypothetical protein